MDSGRAGYRFDRRMPVSHQHPPYHNEVPQDMRTVLAISSQSMYTCGSCSSVHHAIWQLHEHLLLHNQGGSYFYNNNTRTAFPKLDSVSQDTQTDWLKDVGALIKDTYLVCSSTQTEDNLTDDFLARGNTDYSESTECKSEIEVKVERTESKNHEDLAESDQNLSDNATNDESGQEAGADVINDPFEGDTDEDWSIQSLSESSSDSEWRKGSTKILRHSKSYKTTKCKTVSKAGSKGSSKKKPQAAKIPKKQRKDSKHLSSKLSFKCKHCDQMFRNNLQLKRHCIKDHPEEKNFLCKFCDEAFVTNAEAQKHRREHKKVENKCKYCDKILSTAQNLQDHMSVHTGEKMFECKDCGVFFRSRSQLSLHANRKHKSSYDHMCENCGRVFKCRENLKCHIKCCLDIRPFSCKICGKSYPRNTNLNVHMRKHTGDKPFICHTCGMKFAHSNTLTKHMLVHTGERKYTCGTCGQKFKAHNALTDHERIHKQDKRFTCQYCGKGFIKKCNMITHIRQHTGETPYKCNICGQAYKQNVLLKTHMQSHKAVPSPATLPRQQGGEKFKQELATNQHAADMNIHQPSTSLITPNQNVPNQMPASSGYMMNHTNQMPQMPLPGTNSTRNHEMVGMNVPIHSQVSPQLRYQGYSMPGMQ